ncbi:hypothetical protein LOF17_00295 [Sinorhizobium meliloti]|nr:hypothetical protein [Sinorhizobium meliloti]MDE4586353.1 hypothetical protein [Sinorhizobium meliloti]
MIAKHVEKAHRSGRGEWWRKIACKSRNSFVVIGFEPSTVQAISVGLCSPPEGRSSGLCRRLITGWSNQLSRELRNLLEGNGDENASVGPEADRRRLRGAGARRKSRVSGLDR